MSVRPWRKTNVLPSGDHVGGPAMPAPPRPPPRPPRFRVSSVMGFFSAAQTPMNRRPFTKRPFNRRTPSFDMELIVTMDEENTMNARILYLLGLLAVPLFAQSPAQSPAQALDAPALPAAAKAIEVIPGDD